MGPGAVMYTNGLSKSTEFSAPLFTLQITQSRLPNKYITKVGIVLDMLCYMLAETSACEHCGGDNGCNLYNTETTTATVMGCKTSCEGMERYVTSIVSWFHVDEY
ncbi:hypothetical protein TNIN_153871 [Trichonephila inaurata madagascariensis]|uniref:Uncharacterized protein n=1 Tax=Trichonephila inaurata madagascariensis TaxID=2747483 RepID=A0A8X7CCV0_9ARAC|nr:hypothetical protein TNIN_153871 [Trichonephila inaurata madagascariensis]